MTTMIKSIYLFYLPGFDIRGWAVFWKYYDKMSKEEENVFNIIEEKRVIL